MESGFLTKYKQEKNGQILLNWNSEHLFIKRSHRKRKKSLKLGKGIQQIESKKEYQVHLRILSDQWKTNNPLEKKERRQEQTCTEGNTNSQ